VFLGDNRVGWTDSGRRCLVLAPVLLSLVLVVLGVPGSDRRVVEVWAGGSARTVTVLGVSATFLCRSSSHDCSDLAR
jgi:hypothetical protein